MSLASTSVVLPANGTTESGKQALDPTATNGANVISGTSSMLDASGSASVSRVTYELLFSNQVIATGTLTYHGWVAEWNTTSVPDRSYSPSVCRLPQRGEYHERASLDHGR
jgi:hypothetical protein